MISLTTTTTRCLSLLLLLLLLLVNSHVSLAAEQECSADGTCEETTPKQKNASRINIFSDNRFRKVVKKGEHDVLLVPIQYGTTQEVVGDMSDKTIQNIKQTDTYMLDHVWKDDKFVHVREQCQNTHEWCSFWAVTGECENNQAFMQVTCAPACQMCHLWDYDQRCPQDKYNYTDIMKPGDLNAMFERIVNDPQYKAEALSFPTGTKKAVEPWVVQIDDFLTRNECEAMIELGGKEGYMISKKVGQKKADGSYEEDETEFRTSTNAWCYDKCHNHTVTQNILRKIERLTGIPDSHNEFLQLLQYEPKQFYRNHHDWVDHHVSRPQGPRILTVFLYLNNVLKGGETEFERLHLKVKPKRGRALIWPSAYDHNLTKKDPRMVHEALPVEVGLKYGANAWVHLREYKEPMFDNCV